jgi:uncharacterized SAM-binding protein YcdF (DUF218 family)
VIWRHRTVRSRSDTANYYNTPIKLRWVTRAVKRLLIPGSMTFLSLGLVLAVLLLHADMPSHHLGDLWFAALVALYWLLSLPVVAQALIGRLQARYGTIRTPTEAQDAKIIVAVGNGSVSYTDGQFTIDQLTRRSTFCVFEVTRLYRLLQPDLVIVSGGAAALGSAARTEADLMREELVKLGVPVERIRADTASRTTEEQAVNVARLLRHRDPGTRVVVVTTAAHMPRVMKLFVAQGMDVIPSVTPDLRYDDGRAGWARWWPSSAALRGSESAMYEYLALVHLIVARPTEGAARRHRA